MSDTLARLPGLPGARARDSRIFEQHPEHWYVEAAWVWDRLFERLRLPAGTDVLDPACGRGTAVLAAARAGLAGRGSDIVARWSIPGPYRVEDAFDALRRPCAAVVSNPPFKHADAFVRAAIEAAPLVCLLLPATWVCPDGRSRWLEHSGLSELLFLAPRPTMEPGHGLAPGTKLGGGTKDFAILVWRRGHQGKPHVGWLHRDGATLPPDLAALI